MEKVNTRGRMEENTKEIIDMTRNTDLEPTFGQMEENTKDSGATANRAGKV